MASREEYLRQLEKAKQMASAGDWSGAAGQVQDIASSLLESGRPKESEGPWLEEPGLARAARVAGLMSDLIVPFDEPKLDVRTGGSRSPLTEKAVKKGIEELGTALGFAPEFTPGPMDRSAQAAGDVRRWLGHMDDDERELMDFMATESPSVGKETAATTLAGEPEVGSDEGITQALLEFGEQPARIHASMLQKFPSLRSGAPDSQAHRGLMMALYYKDGRPLVADDLPNDVLRFLRDDRNREIRNEYNKMGLFEAPRVGDKARDEFQEMFKETGRTGLPEERSRDERVDFPSF